MKKGDRIGAIQGINNKNVWLFGYGIYDGDHIPPVVAAVGLETTSARLILDNGQVIWSYECWWGLEKNIKNEVGNRNIFMVRKSE